MTLPSSSSDRLMFCASVSVRPAMPHIDRVKVCCGMSLAEATSANQAIKTCAMQGTLHANTQAA